MADKRITELNNHISPQLSDVIPIVNSGETKKIAYGIIYNDIRDGLVSGSSQITITESQISDLSHTDISSLNSYTASNDTTNTTQNIEISSVKTEQAAQDSRLTNIEAATGSYLTTVDISTDTNLAVSDTSNVDMILTGDTLSANLTGGVVSGSSQIDGTAITNNSITISGTSVSLGGSITDETLFGGVGVVSGSSQVVDILDSLNSYTSSNDISISNLESTTASLDTRITNVSASFDTTIDTLTFDQLADVQDYTASAIPNGYIPVWSSGSQEWRPGRPDFEQGKTRLFVAAARSNTNTFYFNSQTRTSDTSASPVADSAFMLVSNDLDSITFHLRSSTSVSASVDIFKNADGSAFSSATSIVTPQSKNLVADTISTYSFTGLTINQFDSIHIQCTPGGAGDFYGIVEIV